MKKRLMKATSLRFIMVAAILLITISTVIIVYLIQASLLKLALGEDDTSSLSSINVSPQELIALKTKIANSQDIINKSLAISVSSSKYQDQATKDLTKYASISGVVIDGSLNYTRPESITNSSQPTFSLLTNMPVTITLANPVSLDSFVKFIKLIEGNLPIMQISGISISPYQNSNTDIMTEPLTIEILTRNI